MQYAKESQTRSLAVLGEQVDRAVTICTRYQIFWGATTRLWEAAYRKVGKPLCLAAAELIIDQVKPNDIVILSAGWVKQPFHPLGEYDGYVGVATLARAINIGLGARVLVVTDNVCIDPFRKVLTAAEMAVWDYEKFNNAPIYRASCVIDFPIDRNQAQLDAIRLLDETHAKVVIAIERADENEQGDYNTAGGGSMAEWTGKVPYLFKEATKRGIPTIGIFDIGNEIGGAFVKDTVRDIIKPGGDKIVGATPTTLGVVARSSNAGAYGIAACMAGMLRRNEILHDRALQHRLMNLMMQIPLADGPTLVSSYTEDGAPAELTYHLLDLLHWLVKGSIEGEGFPWERPPYPQDGEQLV